MKRKKRRSVARPRGSVRAALEGQPANQRPATVFLYLVPRFTEFQPQSFSISSCSDLPLPGFISFAGFYLVFHYL